MGRATLSPSIIISTFSVYFDVIFLNLTFKGKGRMSPDTVIPSAFQSAHSVVFNHFLQFHCSFFNVLDVEYHLFDVLFCLIFLPNKKKIKLNLLFCFYLPIREILEDFLPHFLFYAIAYFAYFAMREETNTNIMGRSPFTLVIQDSKRVERRVYMTLLNSLFL